jgi:dihydrolipoamide dehydrogenase
MSENQSYDVVVIGAGPGGYVAAIRASQLGLKTAIVDKQWLGGVCLNVGCIPSKALLRNADIAHTLRERGKEFGFSFENLQLDFGVAVERSRKVSERLVRGVGFLMKKNNIDVHMGAARLTAKDTVEVTGEDGSKQQLKAKNIILATGAYTATIPNIEVDGEKIVTYLEAILQKHRPESVVIIGAGPIGMEFSDIWSSYGTKVTVVEMLPRILPLEDEDVSAELTKQFRRRKVDLLTNHRVMKIDKTDSGVSVTVQSDDGEKTLEAEQALLAIGFKPYTEGLGLEEVGVEKTERGFIKVDEHMMTNVDGIYAVGDVTGELLLAHVASAMGVVAAETIAGVETIKLDYRMMPRATYTNPQVASFRSDGSTGQRAGFRCQSGALQFPA